jgi:RNA polymerase sigma-70 factor (ECF subfamily)
MRAHVLERRLDVAAARRAAEIEARRAAYAELIRQHEATLLRAAWRLCNGREDVAQDLVQEALVRGYEAFLEGRFREGSNARAWLMRILTNGFLNDYRRRRRWMAEMDVDRLAAEGAPGMEAAQAAPSQRPEAALMASTLEEPLERALCALSEELRVCVVLVDIEDFTYAETAEVLHIPVGTVRSRLSRARQQLYALLYDYARERRRVHADDRG